MHTPVSEPCDRFGCKTVATRWCPLCARAFCTSHERLPDGHACFSAINVRPPCDLRGLSDEQYSDGMADARSY